MPKKYDLTGKVFGRLTVLNKIESVGHAKYKVRCSCGKEFVTRGCDIKNGNTKSCGCRGKGEKEPITKAKEDCFAFVKRQGGAICSALTEMVCLNGECKFYATIEEVCDGCHKNCYKCLTVSHQKQTQYKQKGEA